MIEKIFNTAEHSHEEWLEARRQGIGGSDAATVVGLNKYSSRFSLWCDKVGRLPEKEDTEAMRIGRDLEQYVADRWMEKTGKKCRRDFGMYRNSLYPWALADIDRRVIGENAGVECKTTSAVKISDLDAGNIPLYFYCQCQHYMAVRGFDRMYLAILVLGRGGGFRDFVIERDEEEIAALMAAEEAYWTDYVVAGIPPELDGSEATEEAVKALYGAETPDTSMLMYEHDTLLEQLAEAKAAKKAADAREKELQNQVMAIMGDRARAEGTGYKISWTSQSRSIVDAKALKEALPDVYQRFARTSTSRVLRMTAKKSA